MEKSEMHPVKQKLCNSNDLFHWPSDWDCSVCHKVLSTISHPDGPCLPKTITDAEIVRVYVPSAFSDDDGEYVRIRAKRIQSEVCNLGHVHKTEVTDYQNTLGSGGTAELAWDDAVRKLDLRWLR